jgi:hypothetical protein
MTCPFTWSYVQVMSFRIGLLLPLVLLIGCDNAPAEMAPQRTISPSSSPAETGIDDGWSDLEEAVCFVDEEGSFEARYRVNDIPRLAERGPVWDVGSRADFVWINGTKAGHDRTIIVELYVGRDHYLISDAQPVTVRGRRGVFGYVEDGYGIQWWDGYSACGFHHIELFGDTTKQELIRFANGIRFVER